ncbi:LolA family protein [Dinghuibacter silviterrae]|nr:hypothetical protein [Dinghuibacter silviterrae]
MLLIIFALFGFTRPASSQDVNALLRAVRAKIEQVRDYTADARLVIDVSFMKVPPSDVKVYFLRPDQFKIIKQGGISILPKGGLNISLNALLQDGNYAAIDAGTIKGQRVVKLVPLKEGGDVVLTTLYIDEAPLLVRKAVTTTRNNGTFELDLDYGHYAGYALPDKAVFIFNTSGYKLPKGLSLDYDPHGNTNAPPPPSDAKGQITLSYARYTINKGIPAGIFQ